MKKHGRKTKFLKRSIHLNRGNVAWSGKAGPRGVPKLSDGQKALWTGLNGDAFSVDAVAAAFKERYGRGSPSGGAPTGDTDEC